MRKAEPATMTSGEFIKLNSGTHTSTTLVCVPLTPDYQATHLIVFLPPCLGAFVLSNHSSHNSAFFKFSSPDAPANEGPTACVKQVANFPLPSLLPNQSDTLTKARAAAADGYLSPFTIPLLAEPETLVQPARLNWVLRFPLSRWRGDDGEEVRRDLPQWPLRR